MSRKLLKSTSIVAVMTMLSRILGFVRDIIFAALFGAGPMFDAFVIAFKIPNFLRRLFGEGAFAQAFVPVLSDYKINRSEQETRSFISHVEANLGAAALLVVILAEIAAPAVVLIFAPGFSHDPVRLHMARVMLHYTFPYLFFITLVAFSGAVLNTYNHFTVPAMTPILLNVSLIAASAVGAHYSPEPIVFVSIGVMVGGVLQLLLQLPVLAKHKVLVRPKISWQDPGVRRVLKLMLPALFGVSVAQIGLMVDNFFASYLPGGSISWLYYSDRLTYLPLGVIGVALSTVVMPHLSKHHASGDAAAYRGTLNWALRMVLLIGTPASLGLVILAGPILATLMHHGQFDSQDVAMTRLSLMAFAAGLVAFMLIKILASAFYSRQNVKTPVKIAVLALLVNVALNFIFIKPLAHMGLALATTLAAWVNSLLLFSYLWRKRIFLPTAGWAKVLLALVVAAGAMSWFLIYMQAPMITWLHWHLVTAGWHLILLLVAAIGIYIFLLWLMGIRLSVLKASSEL
jgi:putative peptidoglycan lipid II flippase